MTAETFSPGIKGIITNLVKFIRREQVEMLLPGRDAVSQASDLALLVGYVA